MWSRHGRRLRACPKECFVAGDPHYQQPELWACPPGWLLCTFVGWTSPPRSSTATPDARAELLLLSPRFSFPAPHDDLTVWTRWHREYLHELFPERACCPMTGTPGQVSFGFGRGALRLRQPAFALPMNVKARHPGSGLGRSEGRHRPHRSRVEPVSGGLRGPTCSVRCARWPTPCSRRCAPGFKPTT